MQISVGSDHRGVQVKRQIIDLLEQLGHKTYDVGTQSEESVDYPDIAAEVGRLVSEGDSDRGILICGTGIGMAIAANKFPCVRAAPCHDDLTAEMSRRHNNLNVLCLSADLFGERSVEQLVSIWLETEFEGGRHERRINKISETEAR